MSRTSFLQRFNYTDRQDGGSRRVFHRLRTAVPMEDLMQLPVLRWAGALPRRGLFVLVVVVSLFSNLALSAPVPVTVTVLSVACTQEDECHNAGIEAAGESWPDFYAKIWVNGVETDTSRADDDQASVTPLGWTATATVDNVATPNVPITIQIWDHDSTSGDDIADASPQGDHNNLDLTLNLATGTWGGDTTTSCATGDGVDTNDTEYYPVRVCFAISTLSASGDLDGDGLLDAWESAGYDADGDGVVDVNLPAMGANPRRQDLFLELDYEPGRPPTRDGINEMKAAFAAAPVNNPDGSTGITLHVDVGNLVDANADEAGRTGTCSNGVDDDGNGLTDGADPVCVYLRTSREAGVADCADGIDNDGDGQIDGADPNCLVGDNLGGGQQIGPAGTCGLDNAFYNAKAANFAVNRAWIFRYAIQGAAVVPPPPGGCAGGQGEIGGNDFVSHNLDAGTLMHELGHNLNLQHGGTDAFNCKPNYYSVMNYNMQSGLRRAGGGRMLDYSPPLLSLAGGARAGAPLAALNEGALNESVAVSPGDGANQTVFINALNQLVTAPSGGAINWNGDLDPPLETGVAVNIDNGIPAVGATPAVGAAGCANTVLMVLNGAADWSAVSVPFRQFGDSADAARNPSDDSTMPTDEDLARIESQLHATDMAVGIGATPNPVAAGTMLGLTATVSNLGPNPALAVEATVTLPAGTVRTGALPPGCAEPAPGTLSCALGGMAAGEVRDLAVTAALPADMVYLAGAPFTLIAGATASDRAGTDPQPVNNQASAAVTAVAVADLSMTRLTIDNPPLRMRVGEELVIDLPAALTSVGPSSPMDVVLELTSVADPGGVVSTTWVETFQYALRQGEDRRLTNHPVLTCRAPGRHRFDFTQRVYPHRAPDTDPNPVNDTLTVALEVDCQGSTEVVVNLEPGRYPNRIQIGAREFNLAILTTKAGEYGRPQPFDAASIDVRSLRIGSRRMVEGLEPGTSVFSDWSLSDSYERVPGEDVQDGDPDLLIYYFDTETSGLRPGDREVCVMGRYRDGSSGGEADFYGCDEAEVTRL